MAFTSAVYLGLVGLVAAQTYPQTWPDCTKPPLSSNGVCNMLLSPPERAAAIVDALTDAEKLKNIISKSQGSSRLGLPAYNWWSEALHGIAYAPGTKFTQTGPFNASTQFPMPVLMAAAFDDDLIEQVGDVIGLEARAWGNAGWAGIDYWTPNVNPFKDPRWGRGSETPGEDALRVKRYAASMVKGLEGDKEERRIVSTCKHYAGNDFEDWNGTSRHDFNAKISMQDLAEYYMLPFQQCARDSKVGSIMCSYNAVNGVPACANKYLLQTILREHWNWTEHNNYITSDCEAVLDVSLNHHYAKTNAEGTALCFEAGMDTSCEYESSSDIPGAWSQGLLKIETVNRALLRLYEGLVRAGYFDGAKSAYANLGWSDVNKPSSQKLALQTAVEGIVMLKNDGTAPLNLKPGTKVAMIGFWADDETKIQGGYSGTAFFRHTPAWAARQMGLNVTVANGPVLQQSCANDTWTAPALKAAADAEYILYFGGLDTSAAGETKDRYSLEWPRAQRALLKSLTKLNKPVVVVQMGDQLDDTPLLKADGINSIFWASWPGQDGGRAIMQLIGGEASPAGRLPITMYPAKYVDEIPMTDMHLRPVGGLPGRTYRWYKNPVQPFGFGLHYTTFDVSFGAFPAIMSIKDLMAGCKNTYPDTCAFTELPVTVTNTGKAKSDYVALAFLSGEVGPPPYAIKTLATYGRLRGLAPGETKSAKLPWTLGDVALVDETGSRVLYPGTYTIMLDEPTKATMKMTLTGEAVVLDKWPAPPLA